MSSTTLSLPSEAFLLYTKPERFYKTQVEPRVRAISAKMVAFKESGGVYTANTAAMDELKEDANQLEQILLERKQLMAQLADFMKEDEGIIHRSFDAVGAVQTVAQQFHEFNKSSS